MIHGSLPSKASFPRGFFSEACTSLVCTGWHRGSVRSTRTRRVRVLVVGLSANIRTVGDPGAFSHFTHVMYRLAIWYFWCVVSDPRPPGSVGCPPGADVVGACAGADEVEIFDKIGVLEEQLPRVR